MPVAQNRKEEIPQDQSQILDFSNEMEKLSKQSRPINHKRVKSAFQTELKIEHLGNCHIWRLLSYSIKKPNVEKDFSILPSRKQDREKQTQEG